MNEVVILRNLLDSSSLRRLNLIEYMVQNNNWCKTETIAEQLLCSEGTVKSDVAYFRHSFSKEFSFETSKQKGIRLVVLDSFYIDNFYQRIMRECLNVQFLNLLFSETHNTLEEYADALYTSTSSIKRTIEQVKRVLKNYQLDIQQKPIRIKGSEKNVLCFYGIFFWEEYGSSFLKLPHTYKQEAVNLVTAFKNEMHLSLSTTVINKIILWFIIYFGRLAQGHHIENGYQALVPVSKYIEDFILASTYQLPFCITEEDILFSSFVLESRYLFVSREALQSKSELLDVYDEIGFFLESLSGSTSFKLPDKTPLEERLFIQYVYTLEFKGLNYLPAGQNKLAILNSEGIYDLFMEEAKKLVHKSSNASWKKAVLSNATDFFYILITTWENLTSEIIKKRRRINAIIVSQFGIHHETYLKELIELRFPYTFNIFLLAEESYPEENIDLIITDHEVAETKLRLNGSIPVIGINYSPNNRNWNQLKDLVETIFVQKRWEKAE